MPVSKNNSQHHQSGVATLAITMLLLFAMALIALFANRSLLLEQRISANQYRAMQAFYAAEAGLEWAEAMLNDPRAIDAGCLPGKLAESFREKYVPTDSGLALQPVTAVHPACRMTSDGLECSCPKSGENPTLGGGHGASFSIGIEPISGDTESVKVTSTGCTNISPDCIPGSSAGPADAHARSSVIMKLNPLLRILPGAALTAGGSVTLKGSASLKNTNRVTEGVLVEAGGSVSAEEGTRLQTLPGSPTAAALLADESSLGSLFRPTVDGDGDGVFNAFFGMSIDRYQTSGAVQNISGSTPVDRGQALLTAYQQGFGAFYVDGELEFSQSNIGSSERPLLIVSQHSIACSQHCALTGLIYNDSALRNSAAGGGTDLQGAMITRGDHWQSNGEAISYDGSVLETLRQRATIFTRVPGSWRDF